MCKLTLTQDGKPPEWIQLFPAGEMTALDGRKFSNSDPDGVVARFNKLTLDLPIDWEHATEIRAVEGKDAPASGWIKELANRNGEIWARVEWTKRGADSILSKEYRYISPAFRHTKEKVIAAITSAGLTNRPALEELAAVARAGGDQADDVATAYAREWTTAYVNDLPDSAFLYVERGKGEKDSDGKTAPRTLRHFPYKDSDGDIDLPHLRNAIARIPQAKISGLSADDLSQLQEKARRLLNKVQGDSATATEKRQMEKLLAAFGLTANATETEALSALQKITGSLEATKQELATAREEAPPLDKFVPRADHDAVKCRAEAAEAKLAEQEKAAKEKEIDAEIEAATKAGKITPATVDYHKAQCAQEGGLERFREFVKAAPVVATPSNLGGKKPEENGGGEPTKEELAIAGRCGVTAEMLKASN